MIMCSGHSKMNKHRQSLGFKYMYTAEVQAMDIIFVDS